MKEYKDMTDKEINNLLEELGEELGEDNWHTNEELLKEGLTRWLRLSGFTNQKQSEVKKNG